MNEADDARAQQNYFPRALRKSATCGSKLASDIKHLNFYLQFSIINYQLSIKKLWH